MSKPKASYLEICSVLRHQDGVLFWKSRPSRTGPAAGSRAGGINGEGYMRLTYRGRDYLSHHVVWMLEHGEWPEMLDHKNGIRSDNRPANLRLCSVAQNTVNRSTGGRYRGITLHKHTGKYQAQLKGQYLGLHECEEAAARAYDAAATARYGEFARLNFPELAQLGSGAA